MEREDLITIRNYNPETDKSFILSTFLRGLYYGDSWFSVIPKTIFMTNYHDIATKIVDSSNVRIACLKEDDNVILGYSCQNANDSILHWIFVKTAWRKIGIAKSLISKDLTSASHLNKLGRELLSSKLPNVVFNPFKLENK